ncbi:MAG: carbamoyl phosphate synthase small subunit [Oscillospiraceae bacterium]
MDRKIVLEDGTEYYGDGFGYKCDRVCELVFNTSMVGYQEIVSDPSYTYQMVVMSYPLIGNYGIADDDFESKIPTIGGLIVREYNDSPSNFRYTKTLSEIMEENRIPGISGLDTRKLTRAIRSGGVCKVLMTNADTPKAEALEILAGANIPNNAVEKVSCRKRWYSRTSNHSFNLACIDCGIRQSIIKYLNQRGCNLTILPYNVTAEEIEALNPDGIYISGGPGNPEAVLAIAEVINKLRTKYPICGDGLGFQLICLAYGAKTRKLKCGHYGSNHPVRSLLTGKLDTKGQSQGYEVEKASLSETRLTLTHMDTIDDTVQGVECTEDKVFGVQFYPLGTSDPDKGGSLFDRFFASISEVKDNA